MKQNKQAFTLIELLVVVLIIGILAAIALPQYQKTVEKARMAEAVVAVNTIATANDFYYLTHGNYTNDINELDIAYQSLPDTTYCSNITARRAQNFRFAASNCQGEQYLKAIVASLSGHYSLSIRFDGKRTCHLYAGASIHEKELCQAWAKGV